MSKEKYVDVVVRTPMSGLRKLRRMDSVIHHKEIKIEDVASPERILKELKDFKKEVDDVIKAGERVKVECSSCMNDVNCGDCFSGIKECFNLKNKIKVKADGNKATIV